MTMRENSQLGPMELGGSEGQPEASQADEAFLQPLGMKMPDTKTEVTAKQSGQPLVSVIIPTYNRSWALGKSVGSVLEQTYRPIECVIIDDGSTDDTSDVVKRLIRKCPEGVRIRYYKKENGGPNSARNRGLLECTGEYICYLDSDDTLPSNSVELRSTLLRDNPEYDLCYGRTAVIDEKGRQIRTLNEPWPAENEARIARYLFVSSAPLIRRSLCVSAGFWKEDDLYGQEYEYFARLKYYCKNAGYTYEIVSYYIKHNQEHLFDSSISFNHATYRVLCSVQGLVLFSPIDSKSERQALAEEFRKLASKLSRQKNYATATISWINALWLAPSPKGIARCLRGVLFLLLHTSKSIIKGITHSIRRNNSGHKFIPVGSLSDNQIQSNTEALSSKIQTKKGLSNARDNKAILAWWTSGYNNWGDTATPFIISALSGREVKRGHGSGCIYAVGSIISKVRTGGQLWGCGLLDHRHIPSPFPDDVTIHAVRGPLTRNALLAHGIEVPEIYGDPVLLMPYLYQSDIKPTTGVGIICHYFDIPYLGDISGTQSYKIIDIQAGFKPVIVEVLNCEAIISSSLHGLVLAEAYGKPAAWLQIDKGKHLAGRDFKFKDYILSTQRSVVKNKLRGNHPLDISKIKWLPKPIIDLQQLLESCPVSKYTTLSEIPTQVIH